MKIIDLSVGMLCLAAQPALLALGVAQDEKAKLELLLSLLNTKVEVASKELESASEAPGIISVLTKDDLQRFGGNTLADVLNRVPGLLHTASYFTERSWIVPAGDNIRNFTTNLHVLLLLNGRPVREVQEGGIKGDVYQTFPIEAIDHIEVIKGPGSVLYGSEAISGVINVVTHKPEGNGALMACSFAKNNGGRHWAKADVTAGDFGITACVQRIKPPEWNVDYGFSMDPQGPTTVIVPYRLSPEGQSTFMQAHYLGLSLMAGNLTYNTPYMIQDYLGNIGDERFKKDFLNVGFSQKFGDRWKLDANFTYNQSHLNVLTNTVPPIGRNSHEILGEINGYYYFNKGKFLLGALYSRATGTEKFTTPEWNFATVSEGHRSSRAIYAQADYSFFDRLKAVGGFQMVKVENGKTTVVPRAGLVWNIDDQFNFKLLYGEAYRAPYINEFFIDLVGRYLGNPNLKPERVKSFQASVSYFGQSGEINLSAFRNQQSDIIVYVGVDSDHLRYTNNDHNQIEGLELEGKYFASKNFYLTGSLLVQRPGKGELTGYSNLGAKAGVSYRHPCGLLSLFNVHQGSINSALYNPASSNPRPGTYDLLSLHAKADINAIFDLDQKPKFELFLQGDNMLDKEIWVVASGDNLFPTSLPFNKGRIVFGGMKITF